MTLSTKWWENTQVARASSRTAIEHIASLSLLSSALEEEKCVFEYNIDGNLLITHKQLVDEIKKIGGRLISTGLNTTDKSAYYLDNNAASYTFVWDDTYLSIAFDADDFVYFTIFSLNEELVEKIKELTTKVITKKTKGKAYVFVTGMDGAQLKQINGKAGTELERSNYSQKVLDDLDYSIKELKTTERPGLLLLHGAPGTGKSHIIRGIMDSIENATFVIIQPSMISEIASPQFISVLLDHQKGDSKSIIFIIEDADATLINRGTDNLHSISSLLNLTNGLLENLLRIKVIATTNAAHLEIDKAILRKGRCIKSIEVCSLTKEHANKIYQRLTKSDKTLTGDQKTYTLADVYSAAYDETQVEYKEIKKADAK
jgi:hypothetical protein